MGYGKYDIVLKEGKAPKAFDEMTNAELMEVSVKVMARVKAKSKAHGSKIVGMKPIRRRRKDLTF